mmetsp:Transcript_85210/g.198116  ORF Transcript_85210/g.198116 Transcript_85210/m.198116 type:complete len:95 (+) Transcript_85210:137-421(+)
MMSCLPQPKRHNTPNGGSMKEHRQDTAIETGGHAGVSGDGRFARFDGGAPSSGGADGAGSSDEASKAVAAGDTEGAETCAGLQCSSTLAAQQGQ